MRLLRHYGGWRRDLPDWRDRPYLLQAPAPAGSAADMRPGFPAVYDQGDLGSCSGCACASALAYARWMQGLPAFTPSRLMLYYGARSLEGTVDSDSGAQIRDVIKAAARWGACDEAIWPYDVTQFTTPPTAAAYGAASHDRAIGYHAVPQNLTAIRGALAAGDPIIFGFTVFASFESDQVAQTGVVTMPQPDEGVLGGHAVVAVGYDDKTSMFIVRNSWGDWGDRGYCYMPYAYLCNPGLASDLWVVRLVTP